MPVRLDQFTALYPIIKTWPAGVQRGEEDIQGAKRERERERERERRLGRMRAYCATGVRSTIEKVTGHAHHLSLHFPHPWEDVWVEGVAPGKVPVHLQNNNT